MHFRFDESAPLPESGLHRLPDLDDGQTPDLPPDGSDTRAFRAVLRGMTPEQAQALAARVTEPLPSQRPPPARGRVKLALPAGVTRRQVAAMAVAFVVLLGMAAPLLKTHFVGLAYGLLENPAAAIHLPATGAQVGATAVQFANVPEPPEPTGVPDGPYDNWTPPPSYTSFAVEDFSNDPWIDSFGQCTWWAHYTRLDENLTWMGDAWNWANSARARGLTVTTTAAANATVVFAPYVQGAGGLGHVAHVEQLLGDGWVLVSEMNFFWNGGGEGRVSYRFVQEGEGVWFIH